MPVEIVAKIIPSVRLSKAVTKQVWIQRYELPTPSMLLELNPECSCTVPSGSSYFSISIVESTRDWGSPSNLIIVVLEGPNKKSGKRLLRSHTVRDDKPTISEGAITISLSEYHRYFLDMGCNVKKAMNRLLNELSSRFSVLDSQNISDACAWLVQLTSDNEECPKGNELTDD